MRPALRKYQVEAVDAVFDQFAAGAKKVLLVLPTGTGKTVIFAEIARRMAESGKRTLVVAHRDELIRQAVEKLHAAGCPADVEKAEERSSGLLPATVTSVQTMIRRLPQFPRTAFGLLVVDEAHHALADSYLSVINHFDAPVLGVTATPDRGDKKSLGAVFEAIAYEYTLVQAVKDGYLCDIIVTQIPVEIDVSDVKVTAGDLQEDQSGEAVHKVIPAIASAIAPYLKEEKKTIIFTPLVANAIEITDCLRGLGIEAQWVSGNHAERERIVADFRNGRIPVLSNAMLLTEGFDCPDISCVVPLRPTKSRALYAQMVGRGTRIAEGKERLHILDPLWIAGKHNLCKAASLVSKDEEMASRIQARGGNGYSLFSVASQVEDEIAAEAAARAKARLAELVKRDGRKRVFSPLDVAMYTERMDILTYEPELPWESLPATEKQRATLERFGVVLDEDATRGHASRILSVIFERMKSNKPTLKQVAFLRRLGLPIPDTKEEATALLDRRLKRDHHRI